MIIDLNERVRAVALAVSRATPIPLAVRCSVFLAGLVGIVLAYPDWVLFSRIGALLLLAPLLPAVLPRGRFPALLVILVIVGWLVATAGAGVPVHLSRLLALAGALYAMHSLAALAAALPYDAVVPVEVITRWVVRLMAVVLASAVVTVAALLAVGGTGDRAVLAASLLGLVLAVAVAALLAWLWRRRG